MAFIREISNVNEYKEIINTKGSIICVKFSAS